MHVIFPELFLNSFCRSVRPRTWRPGFRRCWIACSGTFASFDNFIMGESLSFLKPDYVPTKVLEHSRVEKETKE